MLYRERFFFFAVWVWFGPLDSIATKFNRVTVDDVKYKLRQDLCKADNVSYSKRKLSQVNRDDILHGLDADYDNDKFID